MDNKSDYELINGQVIKSDPIVKEESRLMFMLGTVLFDYISTNCKGDKLVYGPRMMVAGDTDMLRFELMAVRSSKQRDEVGGVYKHFRKETFRDALIAESSESEDKGESFIEGLYKRANAVFVEDPVLTVNILSRENAIYDCLDRVQAYREAGVGEHWLIDMIRQFVYVFYLNPKFSYKRFTFKQSVKSAVYKELSFSISELLWEEGGCLRDLSVFYNFTSDSPDMWPFIDTVKEGGAEESRSLQGILYDDYYDRISSVSDILGQNNAKYSEDETYTAQSFLKWLKTREKLGQFCQATELFLGKINNMTPPSFRHQFIQGNLYFALRTLFKEKNIDLQICFSPMALKLQGEGILDCVLRPDIFLVNEATKADNMVCDITPLWVIEIVQPSSASRDYIDKEQIYHYHGVMEYWIINDWKKQVMVFDYRSDNAGSGEDAAKGSRDFVKIYSYEDEIIPVCVEGISIRMSEVLE